MVTSKKFLRIYIWEILAMIFRFASLVVVTPFLAKSKELYGVYALIVSLTIFLNYADFGFLKASKKYATEAYVKGNILDELKYLGFGTFFLLIFTLLFAIVIFTLSQYPKVFISMSDVSQINLAKSLLLVLSISSLTLPFRRLVDAYFKIRLANYMFKRIVLLSSLFGLISVFYFFQSGKYEIVGYFIFLKILDFLVVLYGFFLARNRFKLRPLDLFRQIRFDRSVYHKIKSLSTVGLFLMVSWVLFYELDHLFIGKYFGAKFVGIYSIGWTFPVLLRQIYGILYTPYVEKANYFVGLEDNLGLKRLIEKLISLTLPMTFIPSLLILLFSDLIIESWVGNQYIESMQIAKYLSIGYLFASFSYIMDLYLTSVVKVKQLYISSILLPVVFWVIVMVLSDTHGVVAVSVAKMISFLALQFFYLILFFKHGFLSLGIVRKEYFIPLLAVSVCGYFSYEVIIHSLVITHSRQDFLFIAIVLVVLFTMLLLLYVLLSPSFRANSKEVYQSLKIKS